MSLTGQNSPRPLAAVIGGSGLPPPVLSCLGRVVFLQDGVSEINLDSG